jgi:hypothetical protein
VSTEAEMKYQAKVTLFDIRHQVTVGAGFAVCSNKESGKKFYQEFAIMSMAQTRAIGKAYRNCLAWIIRAAGYEPTPAEEMDYNTNTPAAAAPAPAAAVAQAVPAMQVVPAEAPAVAAEQAAPVQYATASQKEEIIRLLNHPVITRPRRPRCCSTSTGSTRSARCRPLPSCARPSTTARTARRLPLKRRLYRNNKPGTARCRAFLWAAGLLLAPRK